MKKIKKFIFIITSILNLLNIKVLAFVNKVVKYLEDESIPFNYVLLTFFFATTLRNFVEILNTRENISFDLFFHDYLYYIVLAPLIILLFYSFTKEKIEKIARVVLPFFFIVLLAPLLDLIISGGAGYKMKYLSLESQTPILIKYLTFFGEFTGVGITPGMRIEIILVLVGSLFYLYIKNRSLVKSFVGIFLLYSLIFWQLSLPYVLAAIESVTTIFDNIRVVDEANFLYLIVSVIVGVLILFLYNKEYFKALILDIRLTRLLHFELMLILGVILGLIGAKTEISGEQIIALIFLTSAILFAWMYSLMMNNIVDQHIDSISNISRPLILKKIELRVYKNYALIFLLISLFCAVQTGFATFFLILLFIGNYYIYSMPPLRLKRLFVLSKLIISLNSLILIIAGYYVITASINIPKVFFLVMLVGFTLAINFIDIKDYEGDKKAGIKTLPTVFGLKKSKLVIGTFFVLAYILAYLVIQNTYLLLPALLIGCLQFYLINRKHYRENTVFIVYLLSLIFIMAYIILFGL